MNVWITDQCEALNSYLELNSLLNYWTAPFSSDSCLILYLSVRLLFIMLMSLFKLIHAVVFQVMVQCRWRYAMLCTKIHVGRKSLKQKCTCKFKRITSVSVRRVHAFHASVPPHNSTFMAFNVGYYWHHSAGLLFCCMGSVWTRRLPWDLAFAFPVSVV